MGLRAKLRKVKQGNLVNSLTGQIDLTVDSRQVHLCLVSFKIS